VANLVQPFGDVARSIEAGDRRALMGVDDEAAFLGSFSTEGKRKFRPDDRSECGIDAVEAERAGRRRHEDLFAIELQWSAGSVDEGDAEAFEPSALFPAQRVGGVPKRLGITPRVNPRANKAPKKMARRISAKRIMPSFCTAGPMSASGAIMAAR
jgi:hypothetical protein